MTDQPAWTPQYDPPGLSIRATFLATDGSKPQELVVEWKTDPGPAVLAGVLGHIATLAAPGGAEVTTGPAGNWRHYDTPFDHLDPVSPGDTTTQLPRPFCTKTGPGHEDPGHGCSLWAGHEPVEPDGRAHRCACGGIFG